MIGSSGLACSCDQQDYPLCQTGDAMDESGRGLHRSTTRRWFLAGGAAVVIGGAGGAIAELARSDEPTPPPEPPAALLAAAEAERRLIADLDATTGGSPDVRSVLGAARRNHAAHLAALTALLDAYRTPSEVGSSAPSRGAPRTLAQLRAAEQRASHDAARHASALTGGQAALLASIAACEATHAALLQ
jgi:hypothetical protein